MFNAATLETQDREGETNDNWTVHHIVFVPIACSRASVSSVLGQLDLINVLAIQAKYLEASGNGFAINCAFIFRTTNIFICFRGIMAQFELGMHNAFLLD